MKINLKNLISQGLVIFTVLAVTGCATNTELLDGQLEIKKELAEIKKLIKERPAGTQRKQATGFKPGTVNISGSPFLGKQDAPVTIVEFTDYQCPYCKRFVNTTLPKIMQEYVDTGKVKYVLREFPLKKIHAKAEKLAQAALCAGDQGKYWEMHDSFFKGTKKPNPKNLSKQVAELKLNAKAFNACLSSNKFINKIATDLVDGTKLGIRGTPSFVLGKSKKGDESTFTATQMLRGARDFSAFKKVVDELLK